VTGDGSFVNPYLTITYAMSTIAGVYRFNRFFAIYVASGFYQENIALERMASLLKTSKPISFLIYNF
jgi:hypothetical protein